MRADIAGDITRAGGGYSPGMLARPRSAALAALALIVVAVALVIVLTSSSGPATSQTGTAAASAGPESGFDGAPFPKGLTASGFTLEDQNGQRISLSEYRGRVVLLTFLYSTCGDACVVIGQQIRGALNEMEEAHARLPAVLIVSADPAADTPANVRRFLAEVSLTGRAQYLTGTAAQLRSIWHAYEVKPASVGAHEFDEYAPVLLLDPAGEKRVLFEIEELTPEGLSHDVAKLDGDPAQP
jgi:protein SCO1/2